MTIENKTINTIRVLAAEAVQAANSGHPGLPLGAAPMAYALWADQMKHTSAQPEWLNRDRFILSAGHGSALIYTLLHLFGYGLEISDLKNFRQLNSKTPGHPEYGHTIGVETTTGPLGQGVANGVGMAVAQAHKASRFNRKGYDIFDHNIYVIAGDGCMMEGITSEAASLAGTLGLGKLIVLYDSNNITIEGDTSIAFTEDVAARYRAYGWQVIRIEDGNDLTAINDALDQAKRNAAQPTLIEVVTQIGYGCKSKQGKASAHGEPLGADNITIMKSDLGLNPAPFHVDDDVREHLKTIIHKKWAEHTEWELKLMEYRDKYPELHRELTSWHIKPSADELLDNEALWEFEGPDATRNTSSTVLNRLSGIVPNLIGGSADLAPSTKTIMKDMGDFSKEDPSGRNLHFGVREHAMGAIMNGIYLHGGLNVYGATFFVFADYMRPAMRLSALMKLPVIYVLTHDSIGVGEDGPTHQPIEHLASLRCIPDFTEFRPADGKETAAGWIYGLSMAQGPTGLVLTRQALPQLDETGKDAIRGGYVLKDFSEEIEVVLMASGSEVHLAYEAGNILSKEGIGIRVVSMPSMSLFVRQNQSYKEEVLMTGQVKRIAIEAGHSFGWHKYVGDGGAVISIDTFGESGPGNQLFERYGITTEAVCKKVRDGIKEKAGVF